MVAPAQAGSMDLAPEFLEFVRQAIACAASVSLFVAGRDQAACHILGGTRCGVPFPVGCRESAVQLGVFRLPGPAFGTSVPGQQSEQPRPARPVRGNDRAGHLPAIIRLAQSASGVLLIGLQLFSQSYRGFEVGVRLRTVPRCDREPGNGVRDQRSFGSEVIYPGKRAAKARYGVLPVRAGRGVLSAKLAFFNT
jgi:hypothetical protein